jgi:acyl-[acyl-carrier-protein]-phospholipid O-acyltransferase/long-chain-fatty-acid--[acyl-carrier-protein] ligase
VEATATEIWPAALSIVVSLPDARKGERLVLLTAERAATREQFLRHARLKGMSELAVPAEIIAGSDIPLLGSGKPDYVAALAKVKARAIVETPASASDAAE